MQRFTIFVAVLRQQKSPDFYPGQSAGSLPEEARKLHRMCQFDFSNIPAVASCRVACQKELTPGGNKLASARCQFCASTWPFLFPGRRFSA
jgi:hypothetical protein